MIRYLIWDAGGTLFNTYPAMVQACTVALCNLEQCNVNKAWLLSLLRQSRAHAMHELAQTYALDHAMLSDTFYAHYAIVSPQEQPPFPGVQKICYDMCVRGGQNFIITHRGRDALQTLLTAHKMENYFTACITRDDAYPRKPNPASTQALLTNYGLDAAQGLVIGDRDLDIQAGRAAGLRTCFLGASAHPTPADIEITDYAQLYQWLEREWANKRMANSK